MNTVWLARLNVFAFCKYISYACLTFFLSSPLIRNLDFFPILCNERGPSSPVFSYQLRRLRYKENYAIMVRPIHKAFEQFLVYDTLKIP